MKCNINNHKLQKNHRWTELIKHHTSWCKSIESIVYNLQVQSDTISLKGTN